MAKIVFPKKVEVFEVGVRDGLQNEARSFRFEDKVRLAQGLLARTGVDSALATATLAAWSRALDELESGADHTEIARWLER